MRWTTTVVLMAVLAPAASAAPPWQRTEARTPCAHSNPFRDPYFGDLHIHTRFSADAYIYGTRVEPREAYGFARGETAVTIPDETEAQTRSARIDRPLDFAAVTDHAEFFGEVLLCSTPGSPVYDIDMCRLLRQADPGENEQSTARVAWLFPAGIANPPRSHAFCATPGVDCDGAAVSVWQTIQAAAEEAYDRTAACRFTSFVGYEYTASPLGRHLHRNVIFRNATVPPFAASFLDTAAGGTPQGLWSAVETDCLRAGAGCDAVVIPHNSNLSGGGQFFDPADANEAARRQMLEPLVEIHQIKGNSECRFDRLAGAGAGTADEFCTFEQLPIPHEGGSEGPPTIDNYPRRNLVRNVLKDGLAFEQRLGVNPFRLGFVGSTDTHDGTAGAVDEVGWPGGQGNHDGSPANQISRELRTNPGGLAVAWAEENSRDAVFAAFRRRETYATSGTRPVVRFFAGDLAGVACGSATFVRDAYASGTPMGGELGPIRGARSPRFAVWAAKDPGSASHPGTDLQRVQVVKGWLDANGRTQERVFDLAGDAHNGADVDPATCAPRGSGATELCTVWRDPSFHRGQRAFYYVRVLENPTCRWSTRVCKEAGVDPFAGDCAAQAAAAGAAFAGCCLGETTDAFLERVVQERAWTSPIWYRPDGVARLRGQVRFGTAPGTDRLVLRLALGKMPRKVNPARSELVLLVTDDDEIFALTVPPGGLARHGARFTLRTPEDGIEALSLAAGVLSLRTGRIDLTRADRSDHMVTVDLSLGMHHVSHTRLWVLRDGRLVPGGR